jgi:uncharacterized Rmd1/YagE family protein
MRCLSFCTAASYKMSDINAYFKAKAFHTQQHRNVSHITKQHYGDIFVFQHGCVVTWGLKPVQEQEILMQLKPFAVNPLSHMEVDRFVFHYGNKTTLSIHGRFNADLITLGSNSSQVKLAISYGLAQSVKLAVYEDEIQKTVQKNAHLSTELAQNGKILLPRKIISKRIGEIFLARSSINLSSELLDIPEYFWQHSSGEAYYVMTNKFLDIPRRVTALNHKLDVLQELFDILTTQLHHSHEIFLEWIIIILIFSEIVISLADKYLSLLL